MTKKIAFEGQIASQSDRGDVNITIDTGHGYAILKLPQTLVAHLKGHMHASSVDFDFAPAINNKKIIIEINI